MWQSPPEWMEAFSLSLLQVPQSAGLGAEETPSNIREVKPERITHQRRAGRRRGAEEPGNIHQDGCVKRGQACFVLEGFRTSPGNPNRGKNVEGEGSQWERMPWDMISVETVIMG